jgi:ArsR family transcriptional regulator
MGGYDEALMIVNGSGRIQAMATTLPMAEPRVRGVCCVPKRRPKAAQATETADLLKALADPTRVAMIAILRDAEEPVCICDLTASFELSQPTVSHHMARLRDAGLVDATKQGIWSFYRLRRDLSPIAKRLIAALP